MRANRVLVRITFGEQRRSRGEGAASPLSYVESSSSCEAGM